MSHTEFEQIHEDAFNANNIAGLIATELAETDEED